MATQLSKGHTYNPGDIVDAADLNQLVDNASALPGLITEQNPLTDLSETDQVIINRGGLLYKANLSECPFVTSVGLAMPTTEFTVTNSPVTASGTLTAAWKAQPGNKFFAGNGTGAGLTPTFRLLGAQDFAIASVEITGTNIIDWSLGNVFYKRLTVDVTTFSHANQQDGQSIKVLLAQDATGGRTIGMGTGIWWEGAAYPVQLKVANHLDIWEFTCYGTAILGRGLMDYSIID